MTTNTGRTARFSPSPKIVEQLKSAHREMEARGIYPGPTPDEFAAWFWREEEEQLYDLGCPDFPDNRALVYGVTALRFLCGVQRDAAVELLQTAIAEIEDNPYRRAPR